MDCILFLLSFPICFFLLISIAYWLAHKEMVMEYCFEYGKSNYSVFIKEFNKTVWFRRDAKFRNSFFAANSKIHADIIMFNGKGMMLDYFSYIRYCLFIFRNRYRGDNGWRGNYKWK